MEEKVKISILLEMYGTLLTETQREYMDLYYNQDLSLSEIGENEKITRQAVSTILNKSKKKLKEYEEQLQFMKKETQIKKEIENLRNTNITLEQEKIIKRIEKIIY